MRHDLIQIAYIAAAVLFILGLKSMSSPRTARRGIIWAGVGMLVAVVITFATPAMSSTATPCRRSPKTPCTRSTAGSWARSATTPIRAAT